MGWFGVLTTGKVPAPVLTALRNAVRAAVEAPDLRAKLADMGAEPQNGGATEPRTLLHRESVVGTKVIKDRNISLQ